MVSSLVHAFRVETVFDKISAKLTFVSSSMSHKNGNFPNAHKEGFRNAYSAQKLSYKIRISISECLLVSFWGILISMGHAAGDKSHFYRILSKTVSTLNT